MFLELSLLQAQLAQFLQPLFLRKMFQAFDHFCGLHLDLLQYVHVFLVLGAADLDMVLQMGLHNGRLEGTITFLSLQISSAFDTAQDRAGLRGYKSKMLAYIQLFITGTHLLSAVFVVFSVEIEYCICKKPF